MYSDIMKTCTKCNIEKNLSEFHKSKDGRFGVRAICKECIRKMDRDFYSKNKETIAPIKREKMKIYSIENREEINKRSIDRYHRTKQLKPRVKKEKIVKIKEVNPKKTRSEIWQNWYSKNKDYIKEKNNLPLNKMKRNVMRYINRALINTVKGYKSLELIGLSIQDYREYLECQFDNNINWENYGSYWHIDHIIPVSLFDLSDKEEQKKAFNFRNTRPLESKENISKGNRRISHLFDIIGFDLLYKNLSLER